MKRQTVLITHLCLLAVLMLTGCEGNNPLTPMPAAFHSRPGSVRPDSGDIAGY